MVFIDATGIRLVPGNGGKDCPGNGNYKDEYGNLIEMCCDECNFLECCLDEELKVVCLECCIEGCPRLNKKR